MSRRQRYGAVPVRDGLAAERTLLAAERTLLAYARTAFAVFVAGLTGAQLLNDPLLVAVGHVLAVLGVFGFGIGVWRYLQSRRETLIMLRRLETDPAETSSRPTE